MKYLFLIPLLTALHANVPLPWQMDFQPAASTHMEAIKSMHDLLLVVIFSIAIVVFVLLGYVFYRFRESRNPVPSTTTHHVMLEVIWTLVPVVILICVGIPSIRLLYQFDQPVNPEMTIKVIGRQWYWTYEYPVDGAKPVSFDSLMLTEKDLKPGQIRLLDVDYPLVIPQNTTVRVLVTASDVLHSFAVPSLGVKKDAVPGRVNETWFRIERPGMYYGQCSELCGEKHGFMPIAIQVVSKEEFKKWMQSKTGASA